LSGSATTLCIAPSTPASGITFTYVNATTMKISWTRGNGSNSVVRIKAGSAPTALSNGADPAAASTTYASDGIIYNGTGNYVAIKGLTASTTYYVSVYETNCTGTSRLYSTAVTASQATGTTETYYSKSNIANTNATVASNWNTATDGSGVDATAFTSTNTTFIIQSGHQYQAGTGSSTWAGGTTNSVVQINPGGALDINSCTISAFSGFTIAGSGILSGSGALYNSGNTSSFSIPITLSAAATISSYTGGSLTLSGAITNSGNTLTLDGTTTLTLSGLISGGGGLTKAGTGTAILSNASSSYTGTTSIDNGTVRVITNAVTPSAIGPLGLNASLNLNGGALETAVAFSRPIVVTANGSRIDAYGTSGQTVSGGITANGTYTLSLGGTTVASAAGQALTVSGIIGNGTGTLSVTKVLSSTVTLSGNNTYSGTTTIGTSAGVLNINSATALGTGTFAINGSTINNSTAGSITLSNNNPITVGGDFTFTGTQALNLGTGTFTLTGNRSVTVTASTLTIGSNLTGNFMLIKSPTSGGTLTITPFKSAIATWALSADTSCTTAGPSATPQSLTLTGPSMGTLGTTTNSGKASAVAATSINTAQNYFSFKYNPSVNANITQIKFDYLLGSGTNPYTFALYYTNNGGTLTQVNANLTTIQNITANTMIADLGSNPLMISANTTIEFKLFAAIPSGTATSVQIQNFNILGTAQSAFSTSVASITGFATCSGTVSTSQSFTVSGSNMNNNVVVTAPTGYEVSLNNTSFSSSVSIVASGTLSATTVYVRLSTSASGSPSGNVVCTSAGATTQNVSVSGTVTPLPTTATVGSTQTICPISSATLSGNTPSVGTGAWSVVSGPSTSTSQFSSLSNPLATFTPAGGSGTYVVRWTISNGACTASTADLTISATANYIDAVNLQWPASGSVCSGSPFTVYGQVYEPGITPGAGQGAGITAQFGYSTSDTNPNTWTNWTNATYNATSTAPASNDEYMYTFTPPTSGTYYYAFRYQLSTCSAWQYGGFSNNYQNTESGSQIRIGTWDTIYTAAGTSGNRSGMLTVNAAPTITLGFIDDVPVTATSFSIPYSATTGSPNTYSLTTAATGGSSIAMTGFTPVTNATLGTSPITVTIPASAAAEYGFNLTVTNSTTGCSTTYPFQFHVTSVYHGVIGYDQTICSGSTPATISNITAGTSSDGGTITYTWEKSTTAIDSGYSAIAGATGSSYSPGALTQTTYFKRVAHDVGANYDISSDSDPITITVNATSVGGVVTTGKTQTICSGSTPSNVAITGNTGNVVRWEASTSSSFTSPTTISSTSVTLNGSTVGALTATTYIRAVVQNGVCGVAYSSDYATITVTNSPSAGTLSGTQTVCSTGTTTFASTVSGGTWTSGTIGVATIDASTGVVSPASAGTSIITYTVTGTGGCSDATATRTVTVNPASLGGTATATSATLCSGSSTTIVLSGNTGSSIQWQQSADGSTGWANVTGGSGATTSTYTTPNLTSATYYRAVVTSGVCSSTNSSTASVIMEVGAVNTSSQTICSGAANLSANIPTSGTGTWSVVSGPDTSSSQFSNLNVPSSSFIPSTAGTYVIRWTIVGSCTTSADATIVVGNGSSTTWNGTAWSNGAPTSTSTAYITGNYSSTTNGGSITACTLTVSNNAVVNIASAYDIILNGALTVATGSSVTIENNASLVQSANVSNSGNIILKHNSSALFRLDYTLWSSPVAGQNLVLFSPLTSVSPSRFYTYNTSIDLYDPITPPSSYTFSVGKGYLIRMPNTWIAVGAGAAAAWTGTFTGVPNNGNISVTMSNAGQGYNAVGNPYPSALNFANFVYANKDNIEGTVYFWRKTNNSANPVSYSSCTTIGCTVNNGHTYTHPELISVGQGFIVQAKSGRTTLNFTNAMRSSDNINQFFRTSVMNRFWLELTNTSNASFGKN